VIDRQEEEWTVLNAALGEALLDVERTFMNVVDLQARTPMELPTTMQGSKCVQAYLDAWSRLNAAHSSFRRFIVNAEGSLDAA
jgi:hypothetical protein